jgi:predicted DsbA family dithiol-disulfide isomerase
MDRVEYLELKFGGKSGAANAYAPIVERAEAIGLTIDFPAIKRTPNTLDAHRLIHWAGLEGRQTPMVSALFRGYFTEGLDIGDHAVLTNLAVQVGMDKDVVEKLLASDADRDDVAKRDRHSREMGVSGVPTFIVANKHAVPGAQPATLWASVITDLMAEDDQ